MSSESIPDACRSGMVQVTQSVFETLLNLPVSVLETGSGIPNSPLTGAIFYAGAWQGALLLECSEQQARAWSSRLMSIEQPTEEDARDGLGELTNVLAGNLKPLLAPGVSISTPSVVRGSDYSLHVLRGHRTERVEFSEEHGPFRVTFAKVDP